MGTLRFAHPQASSHTKRVSITPPSSLKDASCTHKIYFAWGCSSESRGEKNFGLPGLIRFEGAAHHRDAGAADEGRGDGAGGLLGARFEAARPAHVDALGDRLFEPQVRFRPQGGEETDEGDIGAAGRGVLIDTVARCEHAALDVDVAEVAPLPRRLNVEMHAVRPFARQMAREHLGTGLRRRERSALLQLGEHEGRAAARDPRRVVARLDIAGSKAAGLGDDLRRHRFAERERLRRARRAPATAPPLRIISIGTRPASSSNTIDSAPTGRPWHVPSRASAKAVPTLGWPANGISARGVDAHLRGVGRVFRRQHEGRLGEIELAGDACICADVSPLPSSTTASGLPPNARSVNTSTVTKVDGSWGHLEGAPLPAPI